MDHSLIWIIGCIFAVIKLSSGESSIVEEIKATKTSDISNEGQHELLQLMTNARHILNKHRNSTGNQTTEPEETQLRLFVKTTTKGNMSIPDNLINDTQKTDIVRRSTIDISKFNSEPQNMSAVQLYDPSTRRGYPSKLITASSAELDNGERQPKRRALNANTEQDPEKINLTLLTTTLILSAVSLAGIVVVGTLGLMVAFCRPKRLNGPSLSSLGSGIGKATPTDHYFMSAHINRAFNSELGIPGSNLNNHLRRVQRPEHLSYSTDRSLDTIDM